MQADRIKVHQMHKTKHKTEVLQNFIIGNISNLVSAGFIKLFSFLTSFLLLLLLSDAEAGIFFTAFALSQLLSSFLTLGIPTTVGRLIPFYDSGNKREKTASLFVLSAIILLLSLSITSIALAAFSAQISDVLNVSVALLMQMVLFLFPLVLSNFLFGSLTGMREFNAVALFRAIDPLLKLISVISFISLLGFGATEAFTGLICGKAILLLLMGFFSLLKITKNYALSELFEVSILSDLFGFCSRVYVTSLITSIISQIDTLSLAIFAPLFVAPYNAAKLIANNLDALTVNLHPLLAAALSYFYGAKDGGLLLRVSQKFLKLKIMILGPVSLILMFFSRELMELLFPQYANAYWLLYLLIPLAVFSAFAQTYRISVLAVGRPGIFSKVSLALVFPSLALYFLMSSNFGAVGVLLSYVITNAAFRMGHIYYGRKFAGLRTGKEIHNMILILLMHFAVLLLIRIFIPLSFTLEETVLLAFIFFLEMFLFLFFSKTIKKEEFNFLKFLNKKNQ